MAENQAVKSKLLLVDDDPLFLRYLATLFPRKEYEVVTASNGQEAVQHARRLKPDLIVLDLDMPKPDGIETCKILKADQATKQIPIVVLTATESLEVNQKSFEAGAQVTVLKSVSRERLANIVDVVLQSKSVGESSAIS
ncbi:MAG: PleD family two-component system response regulator [Candidatus Methylomirabilales bacterium]